MTARRLLGSPSRSALALALALAPATLASCASEARDQRFGEYLKGRVALERDDSDLAATSLYQAAEKAAQVARVQIDALQIHLVRGEFSKAVRFANRIHESGERHWMAELARYTDFLARGDFDRAIASADAVDLPIDEFLAAHAAAARGERSDDAFSLRDDPLATLRRQHAWFLSHPQGGDPDPSWNFQRYSSPEARIAMLHAATIEGPARLRLHLDAAVSNPRRDDTRRAFLTGESDFGAEPVSPTRGAAWSLIDFSNSTSRFRPDTVVFPRLAERLHPESAEVKLDLLALLRGDALRSWIERNVEGDSGAGPRLRVAAADGLLRIGDEAGGLAMLDAVAAEFEDDAYAHYSRGDAHRLAGHYGIARDSYGEALARYAAAQRALAAAGEDLSLSDRLAHASGLPQPARRDFLEALLTVAEIEPILGQLHFVRGISHERLGDWPEAEEEFLRSLEIDPDRASVLNYLGYSWVDQGVQLERAMEMLQRALAMSPEDGNIIDSVGWAKYRLGDYEGALADLERAVERQPGTAEIYDHIGDALWKLGHTKEARYQWRRVLTLDADEPLRERAERKLREGLSDD